jgi:hypothetical protein
MGGSTHQSVMRWMPLFHDGLASLTHCIFVDIQPLPSKIAVGISQILSSEASAGIVERLWSKFDALVDQRRSGMSLVMMEAILYLKENRDLWDISDVKTALKKLKENENTARFEERWVALNQEQDRIMADMEALNPTGNDE